MYRALLVDDETLDLEGLRQSIPWNELGIEVAASVNSSFEALEILEKDAVDILVTDIRMPIMSGLELSEKAKVRKNTLKVVFISGYSDFQYAQKAVQISAGGYVLKPVDDEELIQVLKGVVSTLDKEREFSMLKQSINDTMPLFKSEEVLQLDEKMEQLLKAVVQDDVERISSLLDEILILVGGMKSRLMVLDFFLHVLYKLNGFLQTMNENLGSILGNDFNYTAALVRFEAIDDIIIWLKDVLYKINEYLRLKQKKKNSKLIGEIQKYVCDNLIHNLTLKDAADYFAFSPNYLGYLYKEETGENFSDFLIRKRMEKACELLRDPKRKVFEVADLLGYTNLTHFCRRFKETFGVTPGNYRK
jgi:YesN/AraC family two-component response regulator